MVSFGHHADGPGRDNARPLGVWTLTLREAADALTAPALLSNHTLLLVTAGHGSVEVDFTAYPCRPGTLIWARTGQVLDRRPAGGGLDAVVVRWSVSLPLLDDEVANDPVGPIHWQLTGEDEDAVINEVSQLVVDCERHRHGDLPAGLLDHQLAVLIQRILALSGTTGTTNAASAIGPGVATEVGTTDAADTTGTTGTTGTTDAADTTGMTDADPESGEGGHDAHEWVTENEAFRRFRYAVERWYARTRRVEDYATMLGCSVRTLTRASLVATGRSAKQIVDDRVALQARRLLAATDTPIAEIGQRLGFPEPTNFGRFLLREVGSTPGGFRATACPLGASVGTARPSASPVPGEL